jgi:hypothetical protein
MTARWRSLRGHRATSPRGNHVTALPTVIALVAAILLCGLGWIASREVSQAVQVNAQAHVRSNRDAAARALVNQTDDFKLAVETSAATPEVVDSFRKTTAASQDLMQHELSRLVISKGSPWGFLVDTGGRITAMYPAQPALIGKNFAFRDWFKGRPARGGRTYRRPTAQPWTEIRWSLV